MTGALGAVARAAGSLGALTGLGGGVVITPVLALLFGIVYVKEGFSNIRLGVFLEIGTTLGALAGAHLATAIPTSALAVTFGVVLLYSAWSPYFVSSGPPRSEAPDSLSARLRLDSSYPSTTAPLPIEYAASTPAVADVRRRYDLRHGQHWVDVSRTFKAP